MPRHVRGLSAGILVLTWSLSASAQQDAHVHGSASLNLVIDNGELEIEFESPAANIVGFEHAAESGADKAAIENALRILRNPDAMFGLPASADCKPGQLEAELHGHDEAHDHEKSHDEHEHENEQRYDEQHEGHDHEAHGDHGDEHSEFHAHYHFECANSADVTEIALPLFQRFPAIEEIHLQAITPWGQFGGDIEPRNAKIELK
jgi:hypothetical protein